MNIGKLAALAGLASLLGACMNTQVTTNRGKDPFSEELRKGYAELTKFERGEFDWIDAERFARKANAAAAGEKVLPEEIAAWSLKPAKATEMGEARGRLMAALDGGARGRLPADAAEAQVSFDCWIEQEEEGWQTADIKRCKDRFDGAMLKIQGGVAYVVYFDFDRAGLSPEAQRVIDKVLADAKAQNPLRINVAGNADRAGGDQYNLLLSKRRAEAVANALIRGGVARAKLQVEWFGESRTRVKTPDGVREPDNRSVEIRFLR